MNKIQHAHIVPWAAARSIFGASEVLCELNGTTQKLEPQLLPGDRIAIGRKGLTFSHDSFLRAIERGFSMPELLPMLRNPLSAMKAIGYLEKDCPTLRSKPRRKGSLLVVLRAALEALAVYLNHFILFLMGFLLVARMS